MGSWTTFNGSGDSKLESPDPLNVVHFPIYPCAVSPLTAGPGLLLLERKANIGTLVCDCESILVGTSDKNKHEYACCGRAVPLAALSRRLLWWERTAGGGLGAELAFNK